MRCWRVEGGTMSVTQSLRNIAIAVLPAPAIEQIKGIRKRYRRRQWEKKVRNDPQARITGAELVAQLRDLGVERGRDLILHSSMRKVGFIEGGAEVFIAALQEAIGPQATLLMPAYPLKVPPVEHMRDPAPFDLSADRSYMGRITDTFRQLPGALRSAHPTHSVAALGPDAAAYTATHHHSLSPCGPGSPFRRLSEQGGQILAVGIGIGKITSHHTIEDLVEDFPIAVYLPELFTKTVIFPDGHREEVQAKVHTDRWTLVRVDNDEQAYREVYAAMMADGIVQEGPVGQASAHLFRADALDAVHRKRLAVDGTTIYRKSAVKA